MVSYELHAPGGYVFESAALKLGRTREVGLGAIEDQRTLRRTIVTPRPRSCASVPAGSCISAMSSSNSATWLLEASADGAEASPRHAAALSASAARALRERDANLAAVDRRSAVRIG